MLNCLVMQSVSEIMPQNYYFISVCAQSLRKKIDKNAKLMYLNVKFYPKIGKIAIIWRSLFVIFKPYTPFLAPCHAVCVLAEGIAMHFPRFSLFLCRKVMRCGQNVISLQRVQPFAHQAMRKATI